jgi:hypothetical protein
VVAVPVDPPQSADPPQSGSRPLVLDAPTRPSGWFKEWRFRRTLRIYADTVLIKRAIEALETQNAAPVVSPESMGIGKLDFTSPLGDTLTPHEKLLDKWRIRVTVILILVLFGVIANVVFTGEKSAQSATPYVSLISGLAGIALGWMFANAGTGARKSDSKVSQEKPVQG